MLKLLTLTAMLGLVGCVGDIQGTADDQPPIQPPPSGTPTARAAFDTDVYPIIAGAVAKCIGCHKQGQVATGVPATADFVAPTLSGAYDHVVKYPNVHGNFASTAKILTYVTQQGHQGISYSTDETTKIQNWLALELAERANNPTPPGGEGPGQTTARILGEFSACMTQDMITQSGIATACGNMTTQNNAQCRDCHVTCGEGHCANPIDGTFLNQISQHSTYMQKYFMVANAEMPTAAKMDRNIPMFKAVLSRTGIYLEHPTVNNGTPEDNDCTQAMQTFLTLVQTQIDAGVTACGPSKLID